MNLVDIPIGAVETSRGARDVYYNWDDRAPLRFWNRKYNQPGRAVPLDALITLSTGELVNWEQAVEFGEFERQRRKAAGKKQSQPKTSALRDPAQKMTDIIATYVRKRDNLPIGVKFTATGKLVTETNAPLRGDAQLFLLDGTPATPKEVTALYQSGELPQLTGIVPPMGSPLPGPPLPPRGAQPRLVRAKREPAAKRRQGGAGVQRVVMPSMADAERAGAFGRRQPNYAAPRANRTQRTVIVENAFIPRKGRVNDLRKTAVKRQPNSAAASRNAKERFDNDPRMAKFKQNIRRPGQDMSVGKRIAVGTIVAVPPGSTMQTGQPLYALPAVESTSRDSKGRQRTKRNRAAKGRALSARNGRVSLDARVQMANGITYTVRQLLAMSRDNFNSAAGKGRDFGPSRRGTPADGARIRNDETKYGKAYLTKMSKFYSDRVFELGATPRQVRYDLLHSLPADHVISNRGDRIHLWKNDPLKWDLQGVDAPPAVDPTGRKFHFKEYRGPKTSAAVPRADAVWFGNKLPTVERMSKMTRAQLYDLVTNTLGARGYSGAKKAQLLEELSAMKRAADKSVTPAQRAALAKARAAPRKPRKKQPAKKKTARKAKGPQPAALKRYQTELRAVNRELQAAGMEPVSAKEAGSLATIQRVRAQLKAQK